MAAFERLFRGWGTTTATRVAVKSTVAVEGNYCRVSRVGAEEQGDDFEMDSDPYSQHVPSTGRKRDCEFCLAQCQNAAMGGAAVELGIIAAGVTGGGVFAQFHGGRTDGWGGGERG